jgi:tetratricopeptide (TPR) repeat protein
MVRIPVTAGLTSCKKIVVNSGPDRIPSEAQNQYRQATLLLDQGKIEDALDGFKQAVDIAPNYTEALHETGNCLQNLGRHNEASAYYSRALHEIGERLYEIGRYEESLGRYWTAIRRYEEAGNYYTLECTQEPAIQGSPEKKQDQKTEHPADTAGSD